MKINLQNFPLKNYLLYVKLLYASKRLNCINLLNAASESEESESQAAFIIVTWHFMIVIWLRPLGIFVLS